MAALTLLSSATNNYLLPSSVFINLNSILSIYIENISSMSLPVHSMLVLHNLDKTKNCHSYHCYSYIKGASMAAIIKWASSAKSKVTKITLFSIVFIFTFNNYLFFIVINIAFSRFLSGSPIWWFGSHCCCIFNCFII